MEGDFDALVIDSDDLAVADAVRAALSATQRNPDIGRRLRRLVLDAGLEAVQVAGQVRFLPSLAAANHAFRLFQHLETAVESGTVSRDAADRWRAWLEAADASNRLAVGGVLFLVLARKPDT
jgi:hypothetical protein